MSEDDLDLPGTFVGEVQRLKREVRTLKRIVWSELKRALHNSNNPDEQKHGYYVPDEGTWRFDTYTLDRFRLNPFALEISTSDIVVILRAGKRIFKWRYMRVSPKESQ